MHHVISFLILIDFYNLYQTKTNAMTNGIEYKNTSQSKLHKDIWAMILAEGFMNGRESRSEDFGTKGIIQVSPSIFG